MACLDTGSGYLSSLDNCSKSWAGEAEVVVEEEAVEGEVVAAAVVDDCYAEHIENDWYVVANSHIDFVDVAAKNQNYFVPAFVDFPVQFDTDHFGTHLNRGALVDAHLLAY